MIKKVYLSVNDEKLPAIFIWSEQEEDYLFEQIPSNLTRGELNDLVDEVNRITDWVD